jgi:predicted alpha/beta-fold hydrolase
MNSAIKLPFAATDEAHAIQHDASFAPPLWLRNAHVQSTLHSSSWWRHHVVKRARALLAAAEPLIIDCGDGVRLSARCSRQPPSATTINSPWVVILHGWLGSADSNYVLSLATLLFEQGYHVVRLNLRDHGDSHYLNQGLFHSCLIDEVTHAIRAVQSKFDARQLSLVGFSLGGNFALRVAAQAPQVGLGLKRVIAISPAINPPATDAALAVGPLLYRQYFLLKWKRALQVKQRSFPQHYDFSELLRSPSVTELTSKLVQTYSSFSSLAEYYQGYSLLGARLTNLHVPSHVVAALDDPIIPAADIKHLPRSEWLRITTTAHGGHCGFFERVLGERWIDRKVLRLLSE